MDSLLRDLKFSIRSLLKRPALTFIAVLTLAIGVGANSAIFSMINALLLKPLPFPDPERIVALWDKVPSRGVERNEITVANYLDWRAQNKSVVWRDAYGHYNFFAGNTGPVVYCVHRLLRAGATSNESRSIGRSQI